MALQRFESQHRSHPSFDIPMILPYQVIQVFALPVSPPALSALSATKAAVLAPLLSQQSVLLQMLE